MSHPPHLMSGSAVSAFIPFCAFEGQLRISESFSRLPNLTYPICQSFVPTSLDGQLCYKLQVNRTTKGSENREGLVLILDMNEDRSLAVDSSNNTMRKDDPVDFSMNLKTNPNQNSATIHIKTLSSFKGFGSGSYRMTSVKKLREQKTSYPCPELIENAALKILKIAEGKPCLKSASVSCGN